ncbi:hypothetical protein GUITHDRAFT_159585 [Guillardia theta CCMP2712]|uniref:Uncharacterized protein n=1 Tax=Guillardia theta (strain CCMP2712) TaxID=905079 RepID=L1JFV5_GUITC|nr:hypothetical protein GUITHDRAFT_159585 [Guillardia theta CCMP2712]EKX47207.1 hypothetical protein GUITHDRAFT_159585 [Guillardia theta CCMP2712]|eukprot:XP_005834187.1 hypothetical protein GUITHDRAFT_159585 [Guillardia theta CCMP2712]
MKPRQTFRLPVNHARSRMMPLRMRTEADKAAMSPEIDMPSLVLALENGNVRSKEDLDMLMARTPLPDHPKMVTGVLDNGLLYTILPNGSPSGRFECHLQIKAGSADETVEQQGMAHMCEHVSYMGSRKRERLFGTSSQTNAQTDFHQTVYWAACPTYRPTTGKPMLPQALDALLDVIEARFDNNRVEKERSAILSEAAMVNTIDYRVEVQLLSALHAENRLSKRFPIGLINQIQSWTTDQIQAFHTAHYRPNNAHLFVIGDINPFEAEDYIKSMFSHLQARDPPKYLPSEGVDEISLKTKNPYFPPINHQWCGEKRFGQDGLPPVHIYQHELVQAASIHIFAKFPVTEMKTLADYRESFIKRLVVVAMQVRLNVYARGDPIAMAEFSYLDSPREGCAVCALDMTANPLAYQKAIAIAVREIKRMAEHGLSESEFQRCISALLSDSSQLAAQGDRLSNPDQLQFLMESVSCGHTFMDPEQLLFATELVAKTLSIEEVNEVAKDICSHLANFGSPGAPIPSSIVLCAPKDISVSENEILDSFLEAAKQDVEASDDVLVPKTLITSEYISKRVADFPPSFDRMKDENVDKSFEVGVITRQLSNGIFLNYHPNDAESQRAYLRLTIPAGRIDELGMKLGSMHVGVRTLQEGGAMLGLKREQVELFCVDHLIMAEFSCSEELIWMDFIFPTSKVTEGEDEITGLEGVMQILHALVSKQLLWEEDAFERAKQSFVQTFAQVSKNLEAASAEYLLGSMCKQDGRFTCVPPEDIEKLTLEDVKQAVNQFLTTDNVEISISGDFDPKVMDMLALQYLGTVPPSKQPARQSPSIPLASTPAKDLFFEISDSDPRAVAYVAGTAPNRWGVMADGEEKLGYGTKTEMPDGRDYRSHPLYQCVTLQILQEVLNRRLFTVVRERERLTYDANFHLTGFERVKGGWYLVTVTAKPELAEKALEACKRTLHSVKSWDPITIDNIRSAAYELVSKHQGGLQTNRYWVDLMAGIQLDAIPNKDISYISDFVPMVQSIQVWDVQSMMEHLSTDRDGMWTCIGTSGHTQGGADSEESDIHGHSMPGIGAGRRTPIL